MVFMEHPEGEEIILIESSYRNRDKLWPDGQLSLYTDFTLTITGVIQLENMSYG